MKKLICIILSLAVIFTSSGCAIYHRSEQPKKREQKQNNIQPDQPGNQSEPSASDVSFDEALINYIGSATEGNYIISPLSFRYALGLLLEGAEGETKKELLKGLGVESVEEFETYCTAFNDFEKKFKSEITVGSDQKPDRALNVANSVWKNEEIETDFKESFKSAIESVYNAESKTFNKDNVIKLINDWANEKTEGLIPKLLPETYDTENLAVVLMNALYLKDSWSKQFFVGGTTERDFTTSKGETVLKSFMQNNSNYLYYNDDETELVILNMEGGLEAVFVLGNAENIEEKIALAEPYNVTVTIPKFEIETSLSNKELCNFLKSRGVQEIFSYPDFSGMIDYDLYVSDIIQKAKITIDENGCEAAAVTAIMAEKYGYNNAMDNKAVFTADRPFSFYICAKCGSITPILFAGRVSE